MKVLMISTDKKILEQGSGAWQRMKEYGSLIERLDIIVCATQSSGSSARISENTRAYHTNSSFKILYIYNVLKIVRRANISGIDLVTAQDPFETGLAGWLAARCLKAKLQLQIHTDFLSPYFARESLKNRVRVWIAKWLLPKASGIRVVSERIKKSLIGLGLPEEKIVVLPIFVDVAKIQSSPIGVDLHKKYPQFDFIILMASRLEKEKNIGLALEALAEVVKQYSKTGLVIAGEGSQKENLRLTAYGLQLKNNVIFEGWVDDLASYYKTCDIYLSCSNYEGYSLSLIMAAAAGCPVITTDAGVVGEVINKDNALIADIGDALSIAEGIEKLLSDDVLRKELGKQAKESVSFFGAKQEYLEKYKKSWEL